MQMSGINRWLDEGEDDGKIVRELKLKNRTSEQLYKAALVRSAVNSSVNSTVTSCSELSSEPRMFFSLTCLTNLLLVGP